MATWSSYLLRTIDPPYQTYVGATVNVDRRLRQHNGEIAGGAKRTTSRGPVWRRMCHVVGFRDKIECLSFEWHWKFESRKLQGGPLERRMTAVQKLFGMERWTHLEMVWEDEIFPLE